MVVWDIAYCYWLVSRQLVSSPANTCKQYCQSVSHGYVNNSGLSTLQQLQASSAQQ